MQTGEVNVVGSANIDLVVRVDRFPEPGETLTALGFSSVPGGKGANQAVAIGRLGGNARLIGKLGKDHFGHTLIESLRASGVETDALILDDSAPTGVAMITVDANGENMIVVSPGSNRALRADEVVAAMCSHPCQVLLAQLEIPIEAVTAACEHHRGLFVLNPAPAHTIPSSVLRRVDVLTPNETECETLTGIRPVGPSAIRRACEVLLGSGIRSAVVTMGSQGSVVADSDGFRRFPALVVEVVDTTGAGDAFNGALAHFLAIGESLDRSVRLAGGAGSLSVQRFGAQASMPSLDELLAVEPSLPQAVGL